MASRRIAVVGAGPSGLYCVERLLRLDGDAIVDVFERHLTPLGLVRYGVAPDHQATKAVARLLERSLADPRVRLFAGAEIGVGLSLADLRQAYDAVVLATGAGLDRRLGIPGEDLANVVGSGAFIGWINRRKDCNGPPAKFDKVRDVVLVGLGNVAIDVARLLLKRSGDFAGSDLCPEVEGVLGMADIRSITIIGRGAAQAARFGLVELEELLALPDLQVTCVPPPADRSLLTEAIARRVQKGGATGRSLTFRFGVTPVEFRGEGKVGAVAAVDAAGRRQWLAADLVVTCVSYTAAGLDGAPADDGRIRNRDGLAAPGLYVVGWAATGPQGVIPSARTAAHRIADRLVSEVPPIDASPPDIAARLDERGVATLDLAAWRRIDAAERERAFPGRVRRKFVRAEEMLAAARATLSDEVAND